MIRIQDFFLSYRNYILAALLGLLIISMVFPGYFVLGKGPHWESPGGDTTQHIIGMRYFVADEWRFPLFDIKLISPPVGENVIYTDSLPLFALIAKLFRSILPQNANYFGLWFFTVYLLQGISAVFLLRSLDVTDTLSNIAGAAIALSFPAFLHRIGHETLCGHFLILFSLGVYFRTVRNDAFKKFWIWSAILCWLSLLIHAYIFIMVLGIYFASAVQEARISKERRRNVIVASAIILLVSVGLMAVGGYFRSGAVKIRGAYGNYSMNVLSPVVPQISGLFPKRHMILDATGGQYEGFNYLGAGILLLILAACLVHRKKLIDSMKKYWGLTFLLIAFTIFAISNRVFIGNKEIVSLHFVPRVFEFFKSSGRFFWPVGYAIMAGALVIVSRDLKKQISYPLIIVALLLQVIDSLPLWKGLAHAARSGSEFRLKEAPWKSLIAGHRMLNLVPSYHCGGPQSQHILDLVFHASDSATPVNTIYSARPRKFDCNKEASSLTNRSIGEDELLVLFTPPLNEQQIMGINDYEKLCKRFGNGVACSRKWKDFNAFAGNFSDFNLNVPKCNKGDSIGFTSGGNSKKFVISGWSEQGEWGTWTQGPEASFTCRTEKKGSSDVKLSAFVHAFAPGNKPPQTVDVVVNSHKVGTWVLNHEEIREVSAVIPSSAISDQALLQVVFRISNPSSPEKHRISGDTRDLGMEVKWIKVD